MTDPAETHKSNTAGMWLRVIGATICILAVLNVLVDGAGVGAVVGLIVGLAVVGIGYLQKIAAK